MEEEKKNVDPRDLDGDGNVSFKEKMQHAANQAIDMVQDKVREAYDSAKVVAVDAFGKAKEKYADVREDAAEAYEKAREKVADIREDAAEAYEKAKDKAADMIDTAKQKFQEKKDGKEA